MSRKISDLGRKRGLGYVAVATAVVTLGALAQTASASTPTVSKIVKPGSQEVVTSGPTRGGGSTVELVGTNFSDATKVFFGSTEAVGVVYNSATSLFVTPPAGSVGKVDVTVGSAAGSATTETTDDYTYSNAPSITGTSYDAVTKILTINGTRLGGSTATVSIGGKEARLKTGTTAAPVTQSDSALKVVPPNLTGGRYDVVVFTADGVGTHTNGFGAKPAVTKVTQGDSATATVTSGSDLGRNHIRLTGTGFSGLSEVKVGAASADFVVVSDTVARVVLPTATEAAATATTTTAGVLSYANVNIVAKNVWGSSSAKTYKYVPVPTASAIAATANGGSTTGVVERAIAATSSVNTTFTITGTKLGGLNSVKIGATLTGAKTATKDTAKTSDATTWHGKYSSATTGVSASTVHVWVVTPGGTVKLENAWVWK